MRRAFVLTLALVLVGASACSSAPVADATAVPMSPAKRPPESTTTPDPTEVARACPKTAPEWAKPPHDSAVSNEPAYGYYFVNDDRSVWAAAWWAEAGAPGLSIHDLAIKVGWFRPAGVPLVITGQRLDAPASPLAASVPCCYPTRFQATGLIFPTEGCWEVTATADDRALSFVVWVAS